ncbi:hypothetical protein EG329_012013 [Mollisiaceae sp. DMI_Dod_QoI]|nr:hypothetical protein EG329_012013 [Helotiales sp. DMI_Dod_QoI]
MIETDRENVRKEREQADVAAAQAAHMLEQKAREEAKRYERVKLEKERLARKEKADREKAATATEAVSDAEPPRQKAREEEKRNERARLEKERIARAEKAKREKAAADAKAAEQANALKKQQEQDKANINPYAAGELFERSKELSQQLKKALQEHAEKNKEDEEAEDDEEKTEEKNTAEDAKPDQPQPEPKIPFDPQNPQDGMIAPAGQLAIDEAMEYDGFSWKVSQFDQAEWKANFTTSRIAPEAKKPTRRQVCGVVALVNSMKHQYPDEAAAESTNVEVLGILDQVTREGRFESQAEDTLDEVLRVWAGDEWHLVVMDRDMGTARRVGEIARQGVMGRNLYVNLTVDPRDSRRAHWESMKRK